MKKFVLTILLCLPNVVAPAQILTDATLQQGILHALDNIYNFEFAAAEAAIRQIRTRHPQHPVGPMLRAVQLQWQHMPVRENRAAAQQFMQAAQQAITLAEKMLERSENDPEATFFALTGHGYLAMKHHFDDETMQGVGEAKKAYGYLKKGFRLMEKNPEFYFTTGLYNYYVERYPMEHPIVKPVMWFFQNGDMALGLRQMDVATRRGLFVRTETAYYLSQIYLQHEAQPARAVAYAKALVDRYPNNPLFSLRYAESLTLAGRYAEAEPVVRRLKQLNHRMVLMPTRVLEAVLTERVEKDDKQAAEQYQAALRLPAYKGYTQEYHAMAWAGLGRVAARTGDAPRARTYYKRAADLAEYKLLQREARAYLKSS